MSNSDNSGDQSTGPVTEFSDVEGRVTAVPETSEFVLNQTMLRIADPRKSLRFYIEVLGMTLIKQLDFPSMEFSLYFLGYVRDVDEPIPGDSVPRTAYAFKQKALLELTHNWGTESDPAFAGYHDGNSDPRGFGHIGFSVPDVHEACARFEALGVEFVKKPDDGAMQGLAFIKDPDGYWIEILEATSLAELCRDLGASSEQS